MTRFPPVQLDLPIFLLGKRNILQFSFPDTERGRSKQPTYCFASPRPAYLTPPEPPLNIPVAWVTMMLRETAYNSR